MIPDKEIEKLVNIKYPKLPNGVLGNARRNLIRRIFIEGCEAALSNPDYVVIKREDIEKLNTKIQELEDKIMSMYENEAGADI